MTVRTVLSTGVLVAICAACSSNEPPKYPSTQGLTPREAKDMYNAAYERQALYHEQALQEDALLWRVDEKEQK
jgi:hypothetical protein